MRMIKIELMGDVAFESHIKLEEGYRCDVPCDKLGIPYLPLVEALGERVAIAASDGMYIGLAHPDGYRGILREAAGIQKSIPDGPSLIRSLYTEELTDPTTGLRIRFLKGGQVFYAPLYVSGDKLEQTTEGIESVTRIGTSEAGITGEVRCSIVEQDVGAAYDALDPSLATYGALDYSLMLLAPTTFDASFEEDVLTYDYIPASEVRRALAATMRDEALVADLATMGFSHAYIARCGRRMVPLPLCMSIVKLDHEQLRYRLSPGKDPTIVEQDVSLAGAYGTDFCEHYIPYVKPVVERIASSDGTLFDALEAGQVLKGTVYGADEQLRRLAERMGKYPYVALGAVTEEGYGMAYCSVDALREDRLPRETLMSRFDVSCLSHTQIYDDQGVTATRPEHLLAEIERLLGLEGALEIDGLYTDVYTDYYDRFGWESDGPVTRCLGAGSVLRVRTKDGNAVDVSPILHAFIGEECRNGYGEIMCWPATDEYYRVTQELEPDRYDVAFVPSVRELSLGATMVLRVLRQLTNHRVEALAGIDASEALGGQSASQEATREVLEFLRARYDPTADMEDLQSLYRASLERAIDGYERLRAATDEGPSA